MKNREDLRKLLLSIDHKGYPAYKETRGAWDFGTYKLYIDHVQGDPFASPSSVHIVIPDRQMKLPKEYLTPYYRRIALQDHLLRLFGKELSARERTGTERPGRNQSEMGHPGRNQSEMGLSERPRGNRMGKEHAGGERHSAGSGKSGLVVTSRPGQEVLERSACRVDEQTGDVIIRFEIGFPAYGRSINAGELIRILYDFLPKASGSLFSGSLDRRILQEVIDLSDDQQAIRASLKKLGLCAFVADGSVLPRQSGISGLPMKGAVPFVSPEEMAVTLSLPHRGEVRGMGIPRGVTLIVGGGYHGKSTLLQAIERGIYGHIRGDGREYVITDETAVKIRAEDGRSITSTDISLFIHDLPSGKDTHAFSTGDASGSTSQAAGVMEAIESGTNLLLMDEDTSATNFMVRDNLMARVVSREKEPITPFISRIRDLYEKQGISTILVAGSSGAYFYVADTVIQMDRYVPREITALARKEAGAAPDTAGYEECTANTDASSVYRAENFRIPDFRRQIRPNMKLRGEGRLKVRTLSEDSFLLDRTEVDVRALEQIADREQTAALAYALKYLQLHVFDGKKTLLQAVRELEEKLASEGTEMLFDGACVSNGLARPRSQEIFAMTNRYRELRVR